MRREKSKDVSGVHESERIDRANIFVKLYRHSKFQHTLMESSGLQKFVLTSDY